MLLYNNCRLSPHPGDLLYILLYFQWSRMKVMLHVMLHVLTLTHGRSMSHTCACHRQHAFNAEKRSMFKPCAALCINFPKHCPGVQQTADASASSA